MKLIVAGVGPGAPELVSPAALRAAQRADLLLLPCSHDGRPSVAGGAIQAESLSVPTARLIFPMTRDAGARDAELKKQLEALRPQWEKAGTVVLPVIGDAALYATGAYLCDVWRELEPDLELELIPGISAHSLAAACARRFLALGEEILSIIPGTASPGRIEAALRASGVTALYKPSALGDSLRDVVMRAGPWRGIVRVDRAGLPEERVLKGDEALRPVEEYLSVLLLWRGDNS
ncbi:MAG: precorrin-2 C(20)-methyltransferase [Fretibacterium sp.]|nr:precorrin-2 C(20)-methyltransferase [Fretibacterium sp.]